MKGTLSEAKPTDEAFGRVTSCFSFTIKRGEHYMKCALRKLAAKEKGIKIGVTTGVTPIFSSRSESLGKTDDRNHCRPTIDLPD